MSKRTMIYVGAREIQAAVCVTGRKGTVIRACETMPIPEGCMINGLIMNEEEFQSTVADFVSRCRFKLKKPVLLVDSSQIMLKNMAMPGQLKKRQLLYSVRAELAALDNKKEYIYDYSEIHSRNADGTKTILSGGIDAELADQYQEIFAAAGVTAAGMDVLSDGVIHMVEQVPELNSGTIILCTLDGQNAVTYLFSDGAYLMHSRNRLLTKRGDEKIVGELLGRISSMNQFSQSQREFEKAGAVYFCGLTKEEEPGIQIIKDTFQLQTEVFSLEAYIRAGKGVDVDYGRMFGILASMVPTKRKTFNFLSADKEKAVETVEKRKGPGVGIAVVGGVVAVLGIASGIVLYGNMKLKNELAAITAFTESPSNRKEYERIQEMEKTLGYYGAALEQLTTAQKIVLETVQPDSRMLSSIEMMAGGITCMEYTYTKEQDLLTFTCLTDDYRSIPGFIRALKSAGYFKNVNYSGYSYEEGLGRYRFGISARLLKAEGGEQ